MIRRLRLKFIAIVLTVVLIIIFTLGMIINISVINGTYSNSNEFIDNFYEFVTQTHYLPGRSDADNGLPIDSGLFFIRYQPSIGFLYDDLENIIGMESDEALRLAEAAVIANNKHGLVDNYRYRVYTDDSGTQIIVFDKFDDNLVFLKDLRKRTILAGIIMFLITALLVIPISNNVVSAIAEQINSQKEFITNAGHDLKTPIAVISANMDVLSLKDKDNQWIQSTKKQVKYLKKLMNNIIVTSKLMESGFTTPFEDFDLSHTAQSIIEMFTEIAHSRNLIYTSNIEPNIICYGSEFYCSQLITILCENAINYSVKNGRIYIALREYKGNIYFNITNTRDPEENLEIDKLFNRFYRGDKSRSTDIYGNGLGLSMAKSIAEMHSGSISAYCKTNDTITFSVILKG